MNKPLHETKKATQIITSVFGSVLAISGITHGFFEILQGNKPASGLIIQAIGLEYQRWENGDEAFTLIPNYLITGILAVCVGIIIIIWSFGFIHKKYGQLIFLFLFILLTLVGGGLGFILFYVLTWGYATRIHKSLKWWTKILPYRVKKGLSKLWISLLIATALFYSIGLMISVFGIPGITNHDTILSICWTFLFMALIFINITYVSGFAFDINRQSEQQRV